MVVRGVPDRIARDAWWLDDFEPPKGLRAGLLFLPILVGADMLFWAMSPGLGFALWIAFAGLAVFLTIMHRVSTRRAAAAFILLGAGIMPLVEIVQPLSVFIATLALLMFALLICGKDLDYSAIPRAFVRLPGTGIMRSIKDVRNFPVSVPDRTRLKNAFFDWTLPAIVSGIFAVLLIAANPLLDRWAVSFLSFDKNLLPSAERTLFWAFVSVVCWPLLRFAAMHADLFKPAKRTVKPLRTGLINARSVARALVMFNLIFALQTALDLGYLWGGFALPDGMTYANYAHRGAYPLLATALLAGLFALVAQPYLGDGIWVRRLLYLWIMQTFLLVLSSILRLDLYVDVYGLTRLRFAAFVWMGVVAGGLGLIIVQMFGRQSVGWFLARAFGLGFIAVYLCSLANIDGFIARHNLTSGFTDGYVCKLSEGALPAIRAHERATGYDACANRFEPTLFEPDDWREWGYRNARIRRSLALMETEL